MALFLLPARPASVGKARHLAAAAAIRAAITAGHPAGHVDIDVLALVVSELTGNAVTHGTSRVVRGIHGGPRFLVRIAVQDGGVEVAVTDQGHHGDTAPEPGPMPDADAESGRGLALIEALTGRPLETKQLSSGKWRVSAVVPWRVT
jgi:anti-sigma regulatory factor (Ser/Thr protein kinase)